MAVSSDQMPKVVFEYAQQKGVAISVASEDFELVFGGDEAQVRAWMEHDRTTTRDWQLLQRVSPSVAFDGQVLCALRDLGPAFVGELATLLAERFPVRTRRMWTGNRIARACQRLQDERLVSSEPVQLSGRTQIALQYKLTGHGASRAKGLEPDDPRPIEWR